MTDTVFFPDYTHSILSISATILSHYGAATDKPTLPALTRALNRTPKTIVLWILDGMGNTLIRRLLAPNTYLRRHVADTISSVFPPTTTAATTAYYSGLSPREHGWVGWSPYFSETDCYVELFTGKDSFTHAQTPLHPADILSYPHIFDRIRQACPDVCCTRLFPQKVDPDGDAVFENQGRRIVRQARQAGRQFILAYWPEPDHTCHHQGTYGAEAQAVLKHLNTVVRRTCTRLQDSVSIVSADHGHIPVEKVIYLDAYPDLTACLIRPINLDDRVSSVFVKPDMKAAFAHRFRTHFPHDFLLLDSRQALADGLFGTGVSHPRVSGFLGDYLIIATGGSILRQRVGDFVSGPEFKSAHAGLTEQEMVVPLILIDRPR